MPTEQPWHEQLREIREDSGLTLQDLAARTRISLRNLEALDRGDVDSLPGPAFGKGFIRSICSEMGVDPTGILGRYDEALQAESQEEIEPVNGGGRKSRLALFATGVLLVLLLLGAWLLHGRKGENGEGEKSVQAVSSQAVQEPAPEDVIEEGPATAEIPVPPPPDLDLTVNALERTWLRIVTDGGEPWEATLSAGEKLRLRATDQITLVIGNAGGVIFDLNGRMFGPPGQTGQVMSNYVITRENL